MSYFYAQEHVQLEHAKGKARTVHDPQPTVGRGATIEETRAAHAEATSAAVGSMAHLQRQTKETPRGVRALPMPGAFGDNVIAPMHPEPQPKPRVRPGVTDDELRKIWAEDRRKEEAAKVMAGKGDFVAKMTAHGTSPLNPVKTPRREGTHAVPEATQPRGPDMAPPGFKGMGARSEGPKASGLKPVDTAAPFEAPPLVPKKRTEGISMAARPKDTFSFKA